MSSLDAKPQSDSDHREPLAVLIMCGKAKEMIRQDPTQHQVKRRSELMYELRCTIRGFTVFKYLQ